TIFAEAKNIQMNKVFPLLICAFIFSPAFNSEAIAQLRKIPAEVTAAFSEKYPDAANVEWKDRLVGFTAGLTINDTAYLANYDNKGRSESTEYKIQPEDLPEQVNDGFEKSRYAEDWMIQNVDRIELPGEKIQYRILVPSGDIKKRNLYFNSKGRMVKDKLT